LKSLFFGGSLLLAFANTCEILSVLSGGHYGNPREIHKLMQLIAPYLPIAPLFAE